MASKYDYIIIGSGPAGHVSAINAAKLGLKTAIVEKDINMMGGVCLNEGCIPAKAIFSEARRFEEIKEFAKRSGISVDSGNIVRDMVIRSKEASGKLKKGLLSHLNKLGIEIIEATAEFENRSELKITNTRGETSIIGAKKFLIATGSVPRALDEMAFDGKSIISSSEAVKICVVPRDILIIGGGAIGVEFASFFAAMGANVTLTELESEILPIEDRDVSVAMRNILKKAGVKIHVSTLVTGLNKTCDKVLSKMKNNNDGIFEQENDIVLVSVGRVPSTDRLNLSKAGVKIDARGYIPVDVLMQTNVPGIYAAGDVVASPMLAHVAQIEGEIAAFSAAEKVTNMLDYSSVPSAVYSKVQVASVGFTEKQAEVEGFEVAVGKSFFKANGKAVALQEEDGFIKIVVDANTRVVLGAHIVGTQATEIIHEFVMARRLGLTVDEIAGTVHAHPTFSEISSAAAKEMIFKLGQF